MDTYGSHVGSFQTGPLILQERQILYILSLLASILCYVLLMDNYGNGNTGSFLNLAALRESPCSHYYVQSFKKVKYICTPYRNMQMLCF